MTFSARRSLSIARQEFALHMRGPLVWLLMAMALLVSISLNPAAYVGSGGPAADGTPAYLNSMHAMVQVFSLGGFLVYTFFAAIMGGSAVIRDEEVGMPELLHSTPLSPGEYIFGRFAGVMAALSVVIVLHVLAVILWYEILPIPDLAGQRGPFQLGNYLVPVLTFVFPAAWLSCGLGFAVGERTRKSLAVYAIPIIFLGGVLFFLWTWSPPGLSERANQILMVLDPSGLRWLLETIYAAHLGVPYYNAQPVAFDGLFWVRIAFWILVPGLAVASSVPHARRVARGMQKPGRSARRKTPSAPSFPGFRSLRGLAMSSSPIGVARGIWLVAWAELREMRSQPILLIAVPVIVMMVLEFATATDALGAPLMLTAGTMAVQGIEILTVLLPLVIMFSLTESLHKERGSGLAGIHYAMPYSTWALLAGKNLANVVLVAMVLMISTLAAITQLWAQAGPFQVWPLLLVWWIVLAPSFLFWGALTTLFCSVFRTRVAAYASGLLVFVLTAYLDSSDLVTWVNNWALWGTLRWSDMGLFSLNGHSLLLNRAFMTALGVFMLILAVPLFERTERDQPLIKAVGSRLRRAWAPLVFAGLIPLSIGGFLGWEVYSGFQGGPLQPDESEELEVTPDLNSVGPVAPRLAHLEASILLSPAARRMEIQGSYLLVNAGLESTQEIAMELGHSFDPVIWSVDGKMPRDVRIDEGGEVLLLEQPLVPGDSVRIGFSYILVNPRGSSRNGGGLGHFILPAGVLTSTLRSDFLPRLADRQYETPWTAGLDITAPEEYTVTSAGREVSRRTTSGMRTVRWETDYPVTHLNLMAGRWTALTEGTTTVYHHPGHALNAPEILAAAVMARSRYSDWFGPYPWAELRINEFPDLETNATSFPTNISFSEGIGFLTRPDDSAKLAFSVTAHEVAHQWWGNLIQVDNSAGSGVLVEGMANFSTLLLLEERSPQARIAYGEWLERGFVSSRRPDSESALLDNLELTDRDEAGTSAKGALTLWMLSRLIGKDAMLRAVRTAALRYREAREEPSLAGMLVHLRGESPDTLAFDSAVKQWFGSTALPDLRLSEETVESSNGGWVAQATLENVGTADATVDVAASSGRRWTEEFREARVQVTVPAGSSTDVTWTLPFLPESLTADPDMNVLQVSRSRARVDL